MADRKIEYVKLDELKADPRNPKSHDLATIDASYNRFGVVDLITVDGRTGYIISGHGRTTALRDAYARGEEVPEGVTLAEDGSWLVPVNSGWASKNDAEAAAALIAMNRVTEMGGWVDESLLTLLEEISESGAGFEGVGFSDTDMDDLRHLLEDVPDLDELADEYDPDAEVGGSSGANVTIKLTDAAVIAHWHEARDNAKSDDEAARVLFGMDPAPKKARAQKSRAADPTADDLATPEDEEESPIDEETLDGVTFAGDAAAVNDADTPASAASAAGYPPRDNPVDNSASDGLDWSSAATVVPAGDSDEADDDEPEDESLEIDLSVDDLLA